VVLPLLEACDTVVHLASTTTPGSSARNPTIDIEQNVLPASRLIELMTQIPPQRLLFLSSGGSIYGNPEKNPVDEQAAVQPLSYHAAGKVALEYLFQAFAHSQNISLAIVRPSNLYGPEQPLRQGFGLVRTMFERGFRNEPIEIWGDGSAKRDYLFIEDAADACRRLVQQKDATGPFNLGSGLGVSIAQMVEYAAKTTARPIRTIQRAARGTDVHAIVLDSQRLKDATGWSSTVKLDQGLERTWKWISQGTE
jgi:UDP-glucose 4-epimerase